MHACPGTETTMTNLRPSKQPLHRHDAVCGSHWITHLTLCYIITLMPCKVRKPVHDTFRVLQTLPASFDANTEAKNVM